MTIAVWLVKFIIAMFWLGACYSVYHPFSLKMKLLLFGFCAIVLVMHIVLAVYLSIIKPRDLKLGMSDYILVLIFGSVQLWSMKDQLIASWQVTSDKKKT